MSPISKSIRDQSDHSKLPNLVLNLVQRNDQLSLFVFAPGNQNSQLPNLKEHKSLEVYNIIYIQYIYIYIYMYAYMALLN